MGKIQKRKDSLFGDSVGYARMEQVCDAALNYIEARDGYRNTIFATSFKSRLLHCKIRYVGRYYGDDFHHRLIVRLYRPGTGLVVRLCKPLCCFTEVTWEAHKLYAELGNDMDDLTSDLQAATRRVKDSVEYAAKTSLKT